LKELENTHGQLSKKEVVPDDPIDIQRREKVKEAMLHAWSSYENMHGAKMNFRYSKPFFSMFSVPSLLFSSGFKFYKKYASTVKIQATLGNISFGTPPG
jgi:hypothetical protein